MRMNKIQPISEDESNYYYRSRWHIEEQARKRRKEIKAEFEKYLEEEGKKYEGEDSN